MGKFNAPVAVGKKTHARRRQILIGGAILGVIGLVIGLYLVYLVLTSGKASRDTEAQALGSDELATLAAQNSLGTEVVENNTTLDEGLSDSSGFDPAAYQYFKIMAGESTVRFELNEELRGQPTHVVAETDQVAGCIYIDATTPANTVLGPIEVNARTLATDNRLRNTAISRQILESEKDEYEFAYFTPTAITGLPASVSVGTEFTFQITGDLKIRNFTNSVTFNVTLMPVSETRIEGTGTAQVTREQYDLQIPSVQGVANVSNEVDLTIEFVALEDTTCAPQ